MAWYGIDFGTTNSSIAILIGENRPRQIRVSEGLDPYTIPTVAFFDDGIILIGDEAKNRNFHKKVGKYLYNYKPLFDNLQKRNLIWERIDIPGKLVDDVQNECVIQVGGYSMLRLKAEETPMKHNDEYYTDREITKALTETLKHLKTKADSITRGINTDGIVIGIPVGFSDSGKDKIIKAAIDSMIVSRADEVVLLSEPLAIALSYGIEKEQPCKVLVFDYGGGTLDLSVVEIQGALDKNNFSFKVLAKGGAKKAGADLDWMILDQIVAIKRPRFWEMAKVEKLRDLPDLSLLLEEIEQCKIKLSEDEVSEINYMHGIGKIQLTRKEFEELLKPELASIKEEIKRVLESASLAGPTGSVDAVLMAGGSSSIPAVKDMLEEMFCNKVMYEYAGSGTGTRGLALAAKYYEALDDVVDQTYGIWDHVSADILPVISTGQSITKDYLSWEQVASLYVSPIDDQIPTPIILVKTKDRWDPIGIIGFSRAEDYYCTPFICPNSKRLMFMTEAGDEVHLEKCIIPILEVGQIIKIKNTSVVGWIEDIRNIHLNQSMSFSIGDTNDYVVTFYDAMKGIQKKSREQSSGYYVYKMELPDPGDQLEILKVEHNKFRPLSERKFSKYDLLVENKIASRQRG